MWFKNLIVYTLPADWAYTAAELEDKLSRRPLQPCYGFEMQTRGWVEPTEGRFVYTLQRHHLICMGVNQKLLPASIVNQVAKEQAQQVAAEQGYPVGRRQMREIKTRVADDLRAKALTRRRTLRAWIDPDRGLLIVDSASAGKAEELIETLRDTLGSLAVTPLETQRSPAANMGAWLMSGSAVGRFNIEQDLELQSKDDAKSLIRYVRHPLEGREIQAHISHGKTPIKLGLSWNARLAFILNAEFQIKRVQFLDVGEDKADSAQEAEEQFDVDFALMTGEIGQMIKELTDALGGRAGQRDSGAEPQLNAA